MEYKLIQTEIEESHLLYRLDGEAAERHGAIGYMRADFGRDGREFWSTWFDSQPHLKTSAFKNEFEDVINALRGDGQEPPCASRANLEAFCETNSADSYTVRTTDFSYYFRFRPMRAHYDIYCYAYDNRYLLPELAGEHSMPNYCFAMLPSSGEMIRIQRGESGYFLCNSKGMSPDTVRVKVNNENLLRQVTRAQEEAMLAGSLLGWDSPAAKPWNYDGDGTPRPIHQPKKNEHER